MITQKNFGNNSFVCNRSDLRVVGKLNMEVPELHKMIPARKPCVTDVLYNRELFREERTWAIAI